MKQMLGMKRKVEMEIVFLTLVTASLAGCTTSRQTQQEELENLKTRERILTATIDACDAELAKHGKHVVRHGDTLAKVAKDNNMTGKDLLRLNPDVKFGDVHSWTPGIVLNIKEAPLNETSQAIGAGAPQPEP